MCVFTMPLSLTPPQLICGFCLCLRNTSPVPTIHGLLSPMLSLPHILTSSTDALSSLCSLEQHASLIHIVTRKDSESHFPLVKVCRVYTPNSGHEFITKTLSVSADYFHGNNGHHGLRTQTGYHTLQVTVLANRRENGHLYSDYTKFPHLYKCT